MGDRDHEKTSLAPRARHALTPARLSAVIALVALVSLAITRATKSEMTLSVGSGVSRWGECRAPGNSAISTGQ